MTTEFKLSLHSKMIQEGSTSRDSGLGNSGQISGNKRWYCCCGCSHVADILNIQLPYCPAFNPVLMEASLSRESAVTGTEICEENSNAVLRRRQYFILALGNSSVQHAHLAQDAAPLSWPGYPRSSENCYFSELLT